MGGLIDTKLRHPVTVLMYHSVSDASDAYTVSPDAFRRQMEYVASHYEVVRLASLPELLSSAPDGERRVAVTFDDAFSDFLDSALPILERFSIPATMFVATGYVGAADNWNRCVPGWQPKSIMSADELVALHGSSLLHIGAHTVRHVSMTSVPYSEALAEAQDSKAALEDLLGDEVEAFAYPYGQLDDFSSSTAEALIEAGFRVAVTTHWGTSQAPSDLLSLARVWTTSSDSDRDLEAIIEGEDDWRRTKEALAFRLRRFRRSLGA